MSFTFVTALYEIPRVLYDNRSFQTYQEWFSKTLVVPVPMVIYTEEKNRSIIESVRKDLPTKVFYTDLSSVPFYNTKATVESIIKNSPNDSNIKQLLEKNPNVLEFNCYDYIPLVNSKFIWVLDAITHNHFNTDMFFWIDAGLSRFMNFDMSVPKFNIELLSTINIQNCLYIQIGKHNELEAILSGGKTVDESIGLCVNFMMAGFWGGNKELIKEVCEMGKSLYYKEFIEKNRIDNEQALFGFILQKYKNNLLLVPNVFNKNYINYDLFCDQLR